MTLQTIRINDFYGWEWRKRDEKEWLFIDVRKDNFIWDGIEKSAEVQRVVNNNCSATDSHTDNNRQIMDTWSYKSKEKTANQCHLN